MRPAHARRRRPDHPPDRAANPPEPPVARGIAMTSVTQDTPDPGRDDDSADDRDQSLDEPGEDDAVDLEKVLGGEDDEDEEDALDLSDLDELGVDGVVDRLRGGADPSQDEEDLAAAGIGRGRRPQRSPFISAIVLVLATFLLVSMWSDFRYWLGADEAEDVGDATTLIASGRLASGELDGKYVRLRGTPDVQHATRLTVAGPTGFFGWLRGVLFPRTKDIKYIGYLRLLEGRGGLFAAIPRGAQDKVVNTFDGEYVGRVRKLGDDRAFLWLESYFENQKLTEPVDQPVEAWLEALEASGGGALELGDVRIGAGEKVRVVTDTDDVRLQLGRKSFSKSAAEEAVQALGVPWLAQEPTDTFYRFVARVPEAKRGEARAELEAKATGNAENPADPALGVVVLPLRATFVADAGALSRSGGTLRFPYGDNTTSPGRDVVDDKLVERSADGGEVSVPVAELSAIRYERPIEIDADGYVIDVGADPSSERMVGILWLLVLALAGVNVASIGLWVRRRSAA